MNAGNVITIAIWGGWAVFVLVMVSRWIGFDNMFSMMMTVSSIFYVVVTSTLALKIVMMYCGWRKEPVLVSGTKRESFHKRLWSQGIMGIIVFQAVIGVAILVMGFVGTEYLTSL